MIEWLRTLKWWLARVIRPGEPDSQISEPTRSGDAEQCEPQEEEES